MGTDCEKLGGWFYSAPIKDSWNSTVFSSIKHWSEAFWEFLPLVQDWYSKILPFIKEGYSKLVPVLRAIPFLATAWGLLSGWYTRWISKDGQRCKIRYRSSKIKTLVTSNHRAVNEWCTSLANFLMEDGIPAIGSVSLFTPEKQKLPPKSDSFTFLVVFLAPNNCLVYRMNDEDSWIPKKLINLFGNQCAIFFTSSMREFEELTHSHSWPQWNIPKTCIDLQNLLLCLSGNPNVKSLNQIQTAVGSGEFDYEVPKGVVLSNWGIKKLEHKQIEYLVMSGYATYLAAAQIGLTKSAKLIEVLAERVDAPKVVGQEGKKES